MKNQVSKFCKNNIKLILTIMLILVIILFSIIFYNYKINDYSISLVQFLTGIGGLITLGGLFLNVYYLDKRDKKIQTKFNQKWKQKLKKKLEENCRKKL